MGDSDSIAHVAVVILLLGMSVPALATAHDYAGTPFDYEETITVDYDAESTVNQSATVEGYGSSATISVDGDELVEGIDYRWNDDSGTVDWLNTSNTSSGESASISYLAYQRTAETQMAWSIISPLMALFGIFGLVVSVRALLGYVQYIWEATGS